MLGGRKIVAVQRRGKYLVMKLDGADALVVHLGMSGQLLRAEDRAREGAEAHARRHHVHAGRLVAIRRSAHVRRDVRDPVRRDRPAGRGARAPRHRSARDRALVGPLRPDARRAQDEAEAAPDGPEVHRRHRQRLQRRDPVRGGSQVGTPERLALATRGSAPVPRDQRDPAGRGEVPRLVARRRGVRRPVRQAGRVPGAPPGVRPRRAGVRALPPARSTAPATRTARRSTARPARCDRQPGAEWRAGWRSRRRTGDRGPELAAA